MERTLRKPGWARALMTGGSAGIGEALARALAAREQPSCSSLAARSHSRGWRPSFTPATTSRPRSCLPIRTQQEGRVLTVTLDNGPRHFQDRQLNSDLYELLRAIRHDRSVGAVVITGAHPRSFLTHYDVDEILAGAKITPDLSPRAFAA